MILQPPWVNSELQLHNIGMCIYNHCYCFWLWKKKCPVLWHPVENRAEYKLHENSLEATITMDNEQSAWHHEIAFLLYAPTTLCSYTPVQKKYHDHLTLFVFWSKVLQLYLKLAGFLSIQIGFDNFGGLQDITRSCFLFVCSYLPLYATTLLCKHDFLSWSPDPYNVTSVSLKWIHICYCI